MLKYRKHMHKQYAYVFVKCTYTLSPHMCQDACIYLNLEKVVGSTCQALGDRDRKR